MSKGEDKIANILSRENYGFYREYISSELRGKKGVALRYDFAVFKNNKLICFIEVNGEQHYQQVKHFQKNRASFDRQRARDRKKIEFALNKGIPLYIIPYWELENIHKFKHITQDKFLAKSIWHNDNIIFNSKL